MGDVFSKRGLSRFAWRRKKHQHDPAVLARIMADIAAYAPDHLAITGDLTNFSTAPESAAACSWLTALGPSDRITVSPGNHDALVTEGQEARLRAMRPWFGDSPAPGGGEGDDFPFVRRRGRAAIVNLSSSIPTAPGLASGWLGQAQLERLPTILHALREEGLFRVVMLHHPPTAGVVSDRKALQDAAALRGILREQGAELVLHGHAHETVFTSTPGPSGPIPVLATPSASMPTGKRHDAARWHALEIAPDGEVLVVARGLDPTTGDVGELGRYRLIPQVSDSAS